MLHCSAQALYSNSRVEVEPEVKLKVLGQVRGQVLGQALSQAISQALSAAFLIKANTPELFEYDKFEGNILGPPVLDMPSLDYAVFTHQRNLLYSATRDDLEIPSF